MFTFLLVLQALIAALLVAVILVQQSEGGGLGMGGSPTGLMSARGAANFLTRATTILASVFVVLSISLAVVATQRTSSGTIDTSLARQPAPVAPAPTVPMSGTPNGATPAPIQTVPTPATKPAPVVPLAGETRPSRRPVAQPIETRSSTAKPAAAPAVVPTVTPQTVPSNAN